MIEFFNKKGVLLIIVLLVVLSLSMSIMLTIPREVRDLQRNREKHYIDALMTIENAINAYVRESEFKELLNGVPSYPSGWNTNSYGSRYLSGTDAIKFLDNLKDKGYIVKRIYDPPPVFNNKPSSWVVMITEAATEDDLFKYNPY
jgi:type II secretory pathway pseudopilin PulG